MIGRCGIKKEETRMGCGCGCECRFLERFLLPKKEQEVGKGLVGEFNKVGEAPRARPCLLPSTGLESSSTSPVLYGTVR